MKSLLARGNCLLKRRIGIISIVHEGHLEKAPERVCAWCYKVIQEGEVPVTHGICPECAEKEMVRYLEEIGPRSGALK